MVPKVVSGVVVHSGVVVGVGTGVATKPTPGFGGNAPEVQGTCEFAAHASGVASTDATTARFSQQL